MIVILALGVTSCIVLPIAGAAGLIWLGVRIHSLIQGRRLDRSGGAR